MNLLKELQLPPPLFPLPNGMTSFALEQMLQLMPLQVIKSGKGERYHCIGNIRLYEMAKMVLPETTTVPCLFWRSARIDEAWMIDQFLSEVLFQPHFFGHERHLRSQLTHLLQSHQPLPFQGKTIGIPEIAGLLGVSTATLSTQREEDGFSRTDRS
ncbi:MAG: hypothetical protein HQL48_10160 [Gammaproteobacteria bacterium]|nr:hypothetical protein [Gammaproteobacteria bacterium]